MSGLTETYIKEYVEDRQGAYAKLHKQIQANRKLRYGLQDPKVPEVYKSTTTVVRSPIAADILLRVVPPSAQTSRLSRVPP